MRDPYDFPVPYGMIFISNAPIAQLDRASDYESAGRGFESSWARHFPFWRCRESTLITTTFLDSSNK